VKESSSDFSGPTAAGKTTLLSIVSGLLRPRGGRASLLRKSTIGDPRARRDFGLCPQELALYASLTGRENLDLFGRLARMTRSRRHERIETVLAAVGLAASADRPAGTYSGGMKRRLNLAIALLHEPRLLLLDEPTAGVDPQSRHLIFECLTGLRAAGSTIVYTTHYLEEAERLCERIAIIDHGRLLVCAERDELVSGRVRLEERFLELTGREMRD
jgi:ABC-2 type transport system ATP-binding protein